MQPFWNPKESLILTPNFACPGTAHSKADLTCTRCRAKDARKKARRILNEIAYLDPRSEASDIVLLLRELARCLLCKRNHSDQTNEVVSTWIHKMNAAHEGPNPARRIRRIESANQHATELTALTDLRLRANHNEEITTLRANINEEITTLKVNHNEEITTLRANHNEEITIIRANHATEIAALNAQILELQSQNTRLSETSNTLETQLAKTKTEVTLYNVSLLLNY